MRAWLMGSAFVAIVLASAVAQAGPITDRQEVKIPFDFVVNGKELPAGTYTLQQDENQAAALLIQGRHDAVYVLTSPVGSGSAHQDTGLVFNKDGDRYRLMQVWDDSGDGVAIVETK